jgi:F-type H+-transporting ATPase subunit a
MVPSHLFYLIELSVGQHWYWIIFGYQLHGQVIVTTWFVLGVIVAFSFVANRNLNEIPYGWQNLAEYITEFVRDVSKTQIGERDYVNWVPFIGTIFLFVFVSNWSGALLPWRVIEIPNGELAAPTNDINTTVALALLTSIAYFYGGLSKKGFGYFKRYISPTIFLFPINLLEDFTKPLSLSFRLFGNILADELVVGVMVILVPLVVPIPLILLGLFTSAIQALVFATLAGAYIGEAVEEHHLFRLKSLHIIISIYR